MLKIWTSLSYSWRQGKTFTRGQWVRFVGWLAVAATFMIYLVASRYLPFIQVSEAHSSLYLLSAYVGHFGLFPFLAWLLVFVPLALLVPSRWLLLPLGFMTVFLGLALLAVDTTVYAQYRFHLSGFVWELLTAPGAGEMIKLSWFTLVVIAGTLLFIALLVLWSLSLITFIVQGQKAQGKGKYLFASWLVAIVSSQLMHVWYEAHYDAEVTGVTRHLPFYYPVTAKRDLVELGLIDPSSINQETDLHLKTGSNALKYPLNPLQCQKPESPLNVLVIAVDAMRADVFNADVTPHLFKLAQSDSAQIFTDHYSGGNVTKGGIFSLFFGLPPTYWDGFASAQEGALWIRQHQRFGYDIGVFSSATLLSPAFDRTVFPTVENLRLQSEGGSPSERDRDAITDFQTFLAHRTLGLNKEKELNKEESPAPFFSFIFLDSAHGYDVPEGYDKFQPQWERVDHVKLNNDFDPVPYFNRYKNAVGYVDEQIYQLVQKLDQDGILDNTLLVITSDHGEDFNDLGKNFWGHGSSFTQYQTKVPLIMLWPGKDRQVFDYRTSHYDMAPTVLSDVLGCLNPPSDYSIGYNLFDASSVRNWLLVHSYFNYGLVLKDKIVATYPTGGYEVLSLDNEKLKGERMPNNIGVEVLQTLSKFYR